ncbi:hypothetical protein [Leifsonia sp. NPDC080035]|uniref:DUF1795 domain-containing protein n=1 Tax=Leifsonia sp. NPDC080035 TaxID=3143936 RepID=A0AAU7GE20_9MICO
MSDARSVTVEDELTIVFPGTWAMIPLNDPERSARSIARLVSERVGRADRLARVRRTAKAELEKLVALAEDSDAFALAMSMEILPGVPFPASIVMAREALPAGDDAEARLERAFPDGEPLAFSFGPVRRRSSVRQTTYEEESAPELLADYRFEAPDGERIIHLRVNAPMVTDPDLYLELFDAIVDSISFRAPLERPAAG